MLPRNAGLVLIALSFVLACSFAFAAESYKPNTDSQRPGDFSATGVATNIDRSAEIFDAVDQANTYTVLADRATVQLNGGKFGTIRDLKDNAKVRIEGERLSARTILANTVIVLEESGAPANAGAQGYHPKDRVETDGYVTRANVQANEIDIRTRLGNYVVVVRPETLIRRYLYVTTLNDVNDGDDINLTGTVDRDGKIIAERIQVSASNSGERGRYPVGKGYRPPSGVSDSGEREDVIEGTVTYPTSAFERTLGLDTRYGERKVEVPKDAVVLIDGEPGSVHNLIKGTMLRVTGTWTGSTLGASRIETIDRLSANIRVEEPPTAPETDPAPTPPAVQPVQPSTLTGRIIEIDYAKFELTIDAGMKDTKVDARDASITRKGSTRRFSELRKGDKIEVKGDWAEDVLKASVMDVVE